MKKTVVSTVVAMLMLIVLGSIAFAPRTAVEVQVPFKGTTESDRLRPLITPMSSQLSKRTPAHAVQAGVTPLRWRDAPSGYSHRCYLRHI